MSFSRLPYELQETILADQDKSNLTSLCLVSKSFLEIARPLLYRSLEISVSIWGREEELLQLMSYMKVFGEDVDLDASEASYWQKVRRQERFFKTLQEHPAWSSYLLEVELTFETKSCDEPKLEEFLLNIPNLLSLTLINSHDTPVPDRVSNSVIDTISTSSITSLGLESSSLSALGVSKLLQKSPFLKSLSLGLHDEGENFRRSRTTQMMDLKYLEHLKLCYPFHSRFFFTSLVTSPDSLKSLELEWIGVQALVPSLLSDVHHLSIDGEKTDPHAGGGDYPEDLDAQVVSVLDGCSSLKSLRLSDFSLMNASENAKELENAGLCTTFLLPLKASPSIRSRLARPISSTSFRPPAATSVA